MNFGYDGQTLLLTTLQVPADLRPGAPVTLNAKAEWLECNDVCIPGSADLKLTLPVGKTAAPSSQAALFDTSAPAGARPRCGSFRARRDRGQPHPAGPRHCRPV